jgi:hypothetical protein
VYYRLDERLQTISGRSLMLRQVAEGVLVHESEFCQSNAVVVQGREGVLLIDPGVLGVHERQLQHLARKRERDGTPG